MNDKLTEFRLHSSSLWKLSELPTQGRENILHTEDALHLLLPSGLSLKEFERELFKAARGRSLLSALWSRIDGFSVLVFSMGVSVAFSILLGLLSLYEDLFKSLVVNGALESRSEIVWFGICALLFILLATFVPSLAAGEDSRFREWLERWYMRSHRVRRRLHRCLKGLSAEGSPIVLWNSCAFGPDTWVWESLVPAIAELMIPCDLHLRDESIRAIRSRLSRQFPEVSTNLVRSVPWEGSAASSPTRLLGLLDAREQLLLDLLVFLSSANLPESWQGVLRLQGVDLTAVVSLELAEAVLDKYGSQLLPGSMETGRGGLQSLVNSALRDYRLLREEKVKNHRLLKLSPALVTPEALDLVRDRFPHLADRIQGDLGWLSGRIPDPVALLCLLGYAEKAASPLQLRSRLLESLVGELRRSEMYFLVPPFLQLFGATRPEDLYRCLGLTGLQHLVVLFERAGMFSQGIELCRYLQPVNWCRYRMAEGRLLERQGKYREAVEVLHGDMRLQALAQAPQGGTLRALELNLQLSWAVVSGRLLDFREVGRAALGRAGKLLEAMVDGIEDSNILWHYCNNLANYAEWDGDFEAAIAEHRRALMIPGAELKWISGSYVNLGIAQRLFFQKTADRQALAEAVRCSLEGVRLKREMGDRDELPVTLHNAALSIIEAHLGGCAAEYQDQFPAALQMCEEGLEILESSGSTKKKGMLLVERYLLRQLQSDAPAELKLAEEALCHWLDQAPADDGDLFTVKTLLARSKAGETAPAAGVQAASSPGW